MSQPQFRFDQAFVTHPGKVRTHNEDSFIARPEIGLWAVCDGMGGHENGQWASSAIVERLAEVAWTGGMDEAAGAVSRAIQEANQAIFRESESLGKSMGSTTVALLVHGRRFAAIWAGDSRIYVLRDGELHRLTRDHTQVRDMVERGYLTEAEAERHPLGHVISRAVGVGLELELDAVVDDVEDEDVFLLCSDGLTGPLDDAEIAEVLRSAKPEAASERLVEMCLQRGAPDNVTVIAVRCNEITLLSLSPAGATF
ncbi:MAG TPA: protein phosphatase 2C domain-containing protein [Phenylobacterium sp.]|nr:protein phosphatase 2C domain-containing protein [Phenylobacterium sp.]